MLFAWINSWDCVLEGSQIRQIINIILILNQNNDHKSDEYQQERKNSTSRDTENTSKDDKETTTWDTPPSQIIKVKKVGKITQ